MGRPAVIKSEERANELLIAVIGKDWRSRVVSYLISETSPIRSSELAECFGLTVQSAGDVLQAFQTVDLVTAYHRLTPTGLVEKAGGFSRKYYLLGDLQPDDADEFVRVTV